MAYILTPDDLDKLAAAGLNVNGLGGGEEATPEEMAALGVTDPTAIIPEQPDIPVMSPDDPRVKQAPSGPVTALPDAPMATPADQGAGMQDLLAMMTKQQQAPTDPFENLSKRQRMMLGFAAIQDAGQALLGKQGSAFDSLMGRFTDIQDMERKRQAAAAQQAMLAKVMGGQGMGAGGDINSQIQALTQAAMMGLVDPSAASLAITQLREQQGKSVAQEAAVGGGAGALEDLKRLEDMIMGSGTATGFTGWLFSKVPFSTATAARDVADTLRSGMALGALKELKAGGATLGSVSEKELALLESAIAKLNLDLPEKDVLNQMSVIESHYKDAIRRAYSVADQNQKLEFDRYFGGQTPAWVLSKETPKPTKPKSPTDDLTEDEKKALGIQ
jgi:hypothetical protein